MFEPLIVQTVGLDTNDPRYRFALSLARDVLAMGRSCSMNPTRRSAPRAPRTNSVFIFQQGDIQAELRAERTLGRLLKKLHADLRRRRRGIHGGRA